MATLSPECVVIVGLDIVVPKQSLDLHYILCVSCLSVVLFFGIICLAIVIQQRTCLGTCFAHLQGTAL